MLMGLDFVLEEGKETRNDFFYLQEFVTMEV